MYQCACCLHVKLKIHSVQFYNNPCGLTHFGEASNWNFGIWDQWARNSRNPNVKVFIGAPASTSAAGSGFVDVAKLKSISVEMRRKFPSFGGVMLWDASQSEKNGNYGSQIKSALVAEGGTGFTFPACSAPAWSSASGGYSGGTQVSHNGYIWQSKWWSAAEPQANSNGDWSAISACAGGGSTAPTDPGNGGGGGCSGAAAWDSTKVYTGGQQVSYQGKLYKANWWTQGDIPSGRILCSALIFHLLIRSDRNVWCMDSWRILQIKQVFPIIDGFSYRDSCEYIFCMYVCMVLLGCCTMKRSDLGSCLISGTWCKDRRPGSSIQSILKTCFPNSPHLWWLLDRSHLLLCAPWKLVHRRTHESTEGLLVYLEHPKWLKHRYCGLQKNVKALYDILRAHEHQELLE